MTSPAPAQALIFDMDGVIIHSNPVHREAWVLYNRRFGIETDDAMLQRMLGRRNDEIIRDFFGGHVAVEEVAAHGAAKEALYREIIGARVSEALVPGVREFLARHRTCPLVWRPTPSRQMWSSCLSAQVYVRSSAWWWTGTRWPIPNHIPKST